MIRVNIICEGPTEEAFVKKLLVPHFLMKGIILTPRNLETGNQYSVFRSNVIKWMKEEKSAYVTSLLDLYGMNKGFPGYLENKEKPPYQKVAAVEAAVKADIINKEGLDGRKFIPHFQLHEFEALLFSDPIKLEEWLSLDHPLNFVVV